MSAVPHDRPFLDRLGSCLNGESPTLLPSLLSVTAALLPACPSCCFCARFRRLRASVGGGRRELEGSSKEREAMGELRAGGDTGGDVAAVDGTAADATWPLRIRKNPLHCLVIYEDNK